MPLGTRTFRYSIARRVSRQLSLSFAFVSPVVVNGLGDKYRDNKRKAYDD